MYVCMYVSSSLEIAVWRVNGAIQIERGHNITESHQSGDMINLEYIIGHVGDDNISYQIPSVYWLKDGLPFRIAPTNTPDPRANGRLTTELIFTFTESDGGVYQLVSTAADGTMFLAPPIRLNTGEELQWHSLCCYSNFNHYCRGNIRCSSSITYKYCSPPY